MAFFVVMYIKFLCPRSKKVQETIKGVHFLTALSKIPQCYVLAFALKFCENIETTLIKNTAKKGTDCIQWYRLSNIIT